MTCPCNSVPCVCPWGQAGRLGDRWSMLGEPFELVAVSAWKTSDGKHISDAELRYSRLAKLEHRAEVAAVGPLPTTGLASQVLVAPHSAFCDSLQPGPDLGPSEKPCNCRPTGLASAESPTIATTTVDVSGPPVATNVLSLAPAAAPLASAESAPDSSLGGAPDRKAGVPSGPSPAAAANPRETTTVAGEGSRQAAAPLRPAREVALEEALREIRRRIDFSPRAARDWSVHRTTILDVDDIAFRALHNESGNGHVLSPSPVPQTGTQQLELEADHAAGDELAIGREVDDVHADPIAGDPTTRKRKSSNSPAAAPLRPARETVHAAFRQLANARGMTNLPRCILRSDAADDCVPTCVAMTEMLIADRAARPEVAEVERLRELLKEGAETVQQLQDADDSNQADAVVSRLEAWARRAADRRGEP